MSGPINPSEVGVTIPEAVYEAFNEMIKREWNGDSATFALKAVADLAVEKLRNVEGLEGVTRQYLYDKGWMDVEPAYRKAGWTVEFDKPAYYETYEANFTFTK